MDVVPVATGLQQSRRASRARRTLATLASAWLLLAGVLGLRHFANVAHVVDPHTGELRHASGAVGHHSGTHSDYHATQDDHADTDACPIAAAVHQAVDSGTAPPPTFALPTATAALLIARTHAAVTTTVYRLAPKTSPPARA